MHVHEQKWTDAPKKKKKKEWTDAPKKKKEVDRCMSMNKSGRMHPKK